MTCGKCEKAALEAMTDAIAAERDGLPQLATMLMRVAVQSERTAMDSRCAHRR